MRMIPYPELIITSLIISDWFSHLLVSMARSTGYIGFLTRHS